MVLLCSAHCVTCAPPHPPSTFSGPLFALSKVTRLNWVISESFPVLQIL